MKAERHGSGTPSDSDAAVVPGAPVLGSKSVLYAVAAIFKCSCRDVSHYMSNPRDVPKLPLPPLSAVLRRDLGCRLFVSPLLGGCLAARSAI